MASVLVLEACAAPAFAQSEPHDPWEGFNRKAYGFSQVVDRYVLGPLAFAFGKTPRPIRRAISNFVGNLGEPVVFVNDMLQGHVGTAASTLGRFAINTTVGVGGLVDVAARGRIPHHDNNFGTTLGRWGAGPGPYLFLPIFGPSDIRDAFGTVVNFALNPLDYVRYNGDVAVGASTAVFGGLNTRYEAQSQLEALRATSTDPYATLRSYYLQNREAEIRGESAATEALPDIDLPDIPPDNGAAPEAAPQPAPETTPQGAVAPPGGPPAIAQPQPAAPVPPLSGEAGALPRPEATPQTSSGAGAPGPKWLVQPDLDQPIRTAGGE